MAKSTQTPGVHLWLHTKSAMPCCLLYTVGQQLMHAKYFDYSRCPEDTEYDYTRRCAKYLYP